MISANRTGFRVVASHELHELIEAVGLERVGSQREMLVGAQIVNLEMPSGLLGSFCGHCCLLIRSQYRSSCLQQVARLAGS
jgi:hypothetical protein